MFLKSVRILTILAIVVVVVIFSIFKILNTDPSFNMASFIETGDLEQTETPETIDYRIFPDFNPHPNAETVLINFWATWCAPCIQELRDFAKLTKKFPGGKLQILAVGVGENEQSIQSFLAKEKLHPTDIVYLPDKDKIITDSFGVTFLPATIIVNKSGLVLVNVLGIRPWLNDDYNTFLHYLIQHQTL